MIVTCPCAFDIYLKEDHTWTIPIPAKLSLIYKAMTKAKTAIGHVSYID
jgi:hypothetical protein